MNATVGEDSARIDTQVLVRVLEKRDWVKVPLLAADAAVETIVVDGERKALEEKDGYWVLHLREQGTYSVRLVYQVPVERLVGGRRLQFPVPRAPSGRFNALVPGHFTDVHVLPGAGLSLEHDRSVTSIAAALKRTDRVQLLWGTAGPDRAELTRASYDLEVVGEGVFAEAELSVDVDADEPVDLVLLPSRYALRELTIDGVPGKVVLRGGRQVVQLRGHGTKMLKLSFAFNVDRSSGQPAVGLDIPVVPISRFSLQVPGRRDVSIEPVVPLVVEADDTQTRVEAHLPETGQVRFAWTDSRPVPEQNVRMNAESYYMVSADRGGLRVAARFKFNVISGKATQIAFAIPDEVVIYEVAGDGVSDWRTSVAEDGEGRQLSVYLDKPRHGSYSLEVSYDSLLRRDDLTATAGIAVPVIEPSPVHRVQGFLLLLAGEEDLEFEPLGTDGLSPVGEESLPQDVRGDLPAKVAHGFKYVGQAPPLTVRLQEPQREPAKFDVYLNTLLRLDEGALRGQSNADITVKSGKFKELVFRLDRSTTVLDVVAPALLKFSEVESGDDRLVTASFTEEMEGTVRVGLLFERILDASAQRLELAPIELRGAEVQRGHVALESSAAVEVEGDPGEGIHPIGIEELPRALAAGTSNPILLAYKYSHLPYQLAVNLTRHETIETVASSIVAARLTTDLQPQGNLVTRAEYLVVNQSKQFLQVELPENEGLQPVKVAGSPVRPAMDEKGRLIIPLPRTDEAFPVVLAYSQRRSELGNFGDIELKAPRPDLFVDELRWDLQLPADYSYHGLDSNLMPMGAEVPEGGALFSLARRLIGPKDDAPGVSVGYVRSGGRFGIQAFTVLFGLVLALCLWKAPTGSSFLRWAAPALGVLGIFLVIWLNASPWALLAPVLAMAVLKALFAPPPPQAQPA
ncbi:MAG: hypothetical protein AAF533_14325 [Acidobacteriota bacterium]